MRARKTPNLFVGYVAMNRSDLGLEIGSNRAGLIKQPSVLKNNSNNKKRRKSANE